MAFRAAHLALALALPLGSLALAGASTALTTTPAGAASCVKAPTVSQGGRTYLGSNVSPGSGNGAFAKAVDVKEAKFGRLQAVRTYDSRVPASNVWTARKVIADRANIESFKIPPAEILSGQHDAAMTDFFAKAPTTAPIFWSYWHEPESEVTSGEFTADSYRAAFRHLVDLAASVCHANLFPTLILEGYTARAMSKRNWLDYYPGAEYISALAFDPYNGVTKQPTSYPAPATLFSEQAALAKAAGKPWGIAETGSALAVGDSSGAGRADWLRSSSAWLNANGALFVTYFDSVGKGGTGLDFMLKDASSMAAWKSSVSLY